MNPWIHAVTSAAVTVTAAALALFLLRLTLIAATGRLALALMPRASAAARHLVAMATLVALVALPVAMAFLPAWRLPILPPRASVVTAAPTLQLTSAETFVRRTYDSVDGDVPSAAIAERHCRACPGCRRCRCPGRWRWRCSASPAPRCCSSTALCR